MAATFFCSPSTLEELLLNFPPESERIERKKAFEIIQQPSFPDAERTSLLFLYFLCKVQQLPPSLRLHTYRLSSLLFLVGRCLGELSQKEEREGTEATKVDYS